MGYGICGGFGLEDRDEEAFVFDQNGRSIFENECGQEDDSSFVCCPDVGNLEVNIDALKQGFGNPEDELSQVASLPADIQNTINERLRYVKLKRKEQKEAERIEQDITFRIKIPNDGNAKSSPIRSHRLFNRPRKNALVVNEAADEFREV